MANKTQIKGQVKDILTIENEDNAIKLSQRATEINTRTQGELMKEINACLKKTMREKGLQALSAPEIGYPYRILAIKFGVDEIKIFINPVCRSCGGLQLSRETSECIPGRTFIVPRNTEMTIMYTRPTGQPESATLKGLAAMIFQKEWNILDGIVLSDIGFEIFDDWDEATDEERNEIINDYLDSIDLRSKDLQKEINEDKDLKQIDDAITFLESVYKGETILDAPEAEEKTS